MKCNEKLLETLELITTKVQDLREGWPDDLNPHFSTQCFTYLESGLLGLDGLAKAQKKES